VIAYKDFLENKTGSKKIQTGYCKLFLALGLYIRPIDRLISMVQGAGRAQVCAASQLHVSLAVIQPHQLVDLAKHLTILVEATYDQPSSLSQLRSNL
jgi:hypothetical protein